MFVFIFNFFYHLCSQCWNFLHDLFSFPPPTPIRCSFEVPPPSSVVVLHFFSFFVRCSGAEQSAWVISGRSVSSPFPSPIFNAALCSVRVLCEGYFYSLPISLPVPAISPEALQADIQLAGFPGRAEHISPWAGSQAGVGCCPICVCSPRPSPSCFSQEFCGSCSLSPAWVSVLSLGAVGMDPHGLCCTFSLIPSSSSCPPVSRADPGSRSGMNNSTAL